MHRTILTILIATISSTAMAEWVFVTGAEQYTAYYDPATIINMNDMVTMWHLYDRRTAGDFVGVATMSSKGQDEYNCKNERFRMRQVSLHSGTMAAGTVIVSYSDPSAKWELAPPNTVGRELLQIACGRPSAAMLANTALTRSVENQQKCADSFALAAETFSKAVSNMKLDIARSGLAIASQATIALWKTLLKQGLSQVELCTDSADLESRSKGYELAATASEELRQYPEAIEYAKKCLEVFTLTAGCYSPLAGSLVAQGGAAEARTVASKGIKVADVVFSKASEAIFEYQQKLQDERDVSTQQLYKARITILQANIISAEATQSRLDALLSSLKE